MSTKNAKVFSGDAPGASKGTEFTVQEAVEAMVPEFNAMFDADASVLDSRIAIGRLLVRFANAYGRGWTSAIARALNEDARISKPVTQGSFSQWLKLATKENEIRAEYEKQMTKGKNPAWNIPFAMAVIYNLEHGDEDETEPLTPEEVAKLIVSYYKRKTRERTDGGTVLTILEKELFPKHDVKSRKPKPKAEKVPA